MYKVIGRLVWTALVSGACASADRIAVLDGGERTDDDVLQRTGIPMPIRIRRPTRAPAASDRYYSKNSAERYAPFTSKVRSLMVTCPLVSSSISVPISNRVTQRS